MLKSFAGAGLAATMGLAFAGEAHAAAATYEMDTFASGDLAGSPFSAPVEFIAKGDTGNVSLLMSPPFAPDTWDNFPVSLTIKVGATTLHATGPNFAFNNRQPTVGVFGVGSLSYSTLIVFVNAALKHYKMLTSVSPISGLSIVAPGGGQIATDQGLLTLNTGASDGRFWAAVVPEPGTWAMMILGLGGVGAAMRRRRALADA
jgi:hypothetical protein